MAPTKKNKAKAVLKSKAKATPKAKTSIKAKVKTKANIKAKAKTGVKAKTSAKAKVSVKTKAKASTKGKNPSPSKQNIKAAQSPIGLSTKKSTSVNKTSTRIATHTSAKAKGTAWLQPLDDRLLVEIVEEPKVSPGGIILIDSSEQPENLHGIVLSIGRGHQNKKGKIRPIEAKKGDKIIFSKYSGDKITKDGVNFVVIRESDVLGFSSN